MEETKPKPSELSTWRETVDSRLCDDLEGMKALHKKLEENTKLTQQVQSDTSELVSLINSFKGAFSVFDMVGRAAKPLAYIATAATAIWGFIVAIKGGGASR